MYNNIALGEVKNVPTEEIFKLKTYGGYRDKQQMENLKKDIQENGIKNPIELFKNKDGSIEIENGNHRLQIAKELGIKEVPVKFVESWNNIGINKADKQSIKKWENNYNENNKNRTEINESNERTEFFKGSMDDNRNQLGNERTAATNDRLFNRVQEYNDRTSSNSTLEKNNQGLEKSSSFNLPTKNQFKTKDQQIIPIQDENTSKSNLKENNTTNKTNTKDFNESAKQYNIDYQNEDLKEIKQMFDRRKINAYFDENTFQNNNDAFSVWKPTYDEQGNISGREVVFNPKAQDTKTRVQELAIHELGHDLDLNEVQNMILKDASRKENWESARKSLENTYKQAYENDNIQISDENFNKIVDEKATMSILQRELGSQEYVNRLVNQNQSVAKKIYNWVIDKLNKFTGGKNEKLFWTDIKNKFETAYNQEFSKNDSNLKYSVIYNEDGSFNRVKIDDDIFENNKQKSINNTIKDYLEENINEYANIIESGQKVYLGKDLPSEYAFSKSSQNLPLPNKLAKGRASSGLKEIIENASNRIYEKNQKIKHNIDAKYGFYKYDTKFSFDHKGKEQIYSGTIVIRNDANGKKYLYDITNIKKIGSDLLPLASNSKKSSAIIGSSNDLPINSLSSTKQNVNKKPLQKYSMQKNENNSIKINSDRKAKYIDKNQEEHNIYYRFDKKGEFKGKEHKSGVSMWEEQVEDLINDNYESFYDKNDNYIEKNPLLEKYGVTQEEYNNMSNEENLNIKREIALDEGYVTNGASVFDLSDDGADFFFNYEKDHHYLDAPEVNFFTGKITGEGIDGENVVIPNDTILKTTSKDIEKIYDNIYNKYDLDDLGDRKKANKEFVQRIVDLINSNKTKTEAENNTSSFNLKKGKQKYALPIKDWQQFVENNYQKQGIGKNLKEYNLPTKEDVKTKINLPTKENVNTQGESINWNEIERPEGKIRKHYRSIIEAVI